VGKYLNWTGSEKIDTRQQLRKINLHLCLSLVEAFNEITIIYKTSKTIPNSNLATKHYPLCLFFWFSGEFQSFFFGKSFSQSWEKIRLFRIGKEPNIGLCYIRMKSPETTNFPASKGLIFMTTLPMETSYFCGKLSFASINSDESCECSAFIYIR